jgi:GntR family transcriptional regulator
MIHNNPTLPIYLQLESLVRDKLDNGEWPPGAMLPSERQLCESYGIARMTVRQAISNLVAEGLLTRVQGRGTFVARPPLRQSLSKLTSFSEDMRDRGLLATTRLLFREQLPASPEIAALLAVAAGTSIVQLRRLRSANGYPISIETATLRGDIAAPLLHEDLEHQSLYRLLDERCGVHMLRASQEIEAGIASEAEGRLLSVPAGAPVLRIQRRSLGMWQGEEVLCEHVRSIYRGDRYRFYVELER